MDVLWNVLCRVCIRCCVWVGFGLRGLCDEEAISAVCDVVDTVRCVATD